MNMQSKETITLVSKERIEELESLFWSETNDEWTQEWRDELSPAELALVDKWDCRCANGIAKLFEAIAAASDRRNRLTNQIIP